MQLISMFHEGFRLLLCIIDIFSNYSSVDPLRDKKDIKFTNAFQKISKNLIKTKQNVG